MEPDTKQLNEECKKHICECENCGLYPLKHFEKCPKCGSESFHKYPSKQYIQENNQEDDQNNQITKNKIIKNE